MARNPRTQTKTTVTPNFRPVDTFVQPAPLDTTRIRELDSFVANLVRRINRYAQVEQGRRDKKDVIAAEKAFASQINCSPIKKGSYFPIVIFFFISHSITKLHIYQ